MVFIFVVFVFILLRSFIREGVIFWVVENVFKDLINGGMFWN